MERFNATSGAEFANGLALWMIILTFEVSCKTMKESGLKLRSKMKGLGWGIIFCFIKFN